MLPSLFDALYPPRCLVCSRGLPSVEPSLCPEHFLPCDDEAHVCPRCAAPTSPHLPRETPCARCRERPPAFQRTLALGEYHSAAALRDWILQLKHAGRRDLAQPLGEALARLVAAEPASWTDGALLVPVPLHPLRRLERGHDQALLLARAIAGESGLGLQRALRRRRYTTPQGAPGQRSRQANVQSAFEAARGTRALRERPVWIVDDVLTSGATASECARLLRRGGAARVGLLVVARAGVRAS